MLFAVSPALFIAGAFSVFWGHMKTGIILMMGACMGTALLAQPSIASGGVLNAGSFTKDSQGHGTAVAPGSLVAIFGSFPGATVAAADTIPYSTSLGGI